MDMGTFILGVLFGWLAEWIYVTFFGNKGSEGLSDCTAYERELRTRNEEIKSLKAKLSDASTGTTSGSSLMRTPVVGKNSTSAKKASPTKRKVAPTNTSSSSKKTTAKSATATKSATVKASTAAKKPAKVATKRATSTTKNSTKTTTQATAKKAPVRKSGSKKDIKLNNPSGDDLTKLSGIGPSMAATMNELGITSYAKLAAMDDDILRDMLEASGARLNNNKEAMDSWNEQATLADKGDFEGLKKLQKALKS